MQVEPKTDEQELLLQGMGNGGWLRLAGIGWLSCCPVVVVVEAFGLVWC
jgi:hypothetical protein